MSDADRLRELARNLAAYWKGSSDPDMQDSDCRDGSVAILALLDRLAAAEAREREAYERAATLISTGEFCRYVRHGQDYCDCGLMASAIRALADTPKG
jgi:hypothetical protein